MIENENPVISDLYSMAKSEDKNVSQEREITKICKTIANKMTPKLVEMAKKSTTENRASISSVMSQVASTEGGPKALVAAGAIPALAAMAGQPDNKEQENQAIALAMANISNSNVGIESLIENKAISVLNSMSNKNWLVDTSISQIAKNILSFNAMDKFISQVRLDDPSEQQNFVNTISLMLTGNGNKTDTEYVNLLIENDRAINMLVEVTKNSAPENQASITLVMRQVASTEDGAKALVDAGAVPALVNMAVQPDIIVSLAIAIERTEGGKDALVAAGAIPVLENLAQSKQNSDQLNSKINRLLRLII